MLRTRTARRALLPVALLSAGALLRAGCGGDDDSTKDSAPTPTASTTPTDDATANTDADGCTEFESGAASDAVKISGAMLSPKVDFKKPLKADSLQRTIVKRGGGETTKPGAQVKAYVAAYRGSDGKALGGQTIPLTVGDSSQVGAFASGIDCVPTGSRVATVVPAKDLYGADGNPDAGIKADDTVVIVTDVLPPLKPAAWTKQVPTVTFAASGKPTLKLPAGGPPAGLVLKVLKQGNGKVVGSGDNVTVDYQGTIWRTKAIFDQSYGKSPATFSTGGVVEGFGAALVGQKVGTRLVVSIPPEYGYGTSGNPQAKIKGTDTIVFVVEIKSTSAS